MKFLSAIKNVMKNNPITKFYDLKKQNKILMDGILRPNSGSLDGQSELIYPTWKYGSNVLYDFSYNSDVLSPIHAALRREIVRNGYDLTEADNTDEEVTTSEEEAKIQKLNREEVLYFLEHCNENGQNVLDVIEELEDDFSIMDDAFMMMNFDYFYDESSPEIQEMKLKEVLRIDPKYIALVQNKFDMRGFNNNGDEILGCVCDRTQTIDNPNPDQKIVCPNCGLYMKRVHFKANYGEEKFYFGNEVIYKNKYRPSKRRGYSPVITAWQKVRTLYFQDRYEMLKYEGQRPPKAGLFFKTSDQDALERAWDKAKQNANENPHLPTVMGVPNGDNGTGFVEFIDFTSSLSSTESAEMRKDYTKVVGSLYGVEPIFTNDTSTSGGLNNEGLQITVTNRAVEYGQSIYNRSFLPAILEALGARGWHLCLNPSEEQDQMAKLQRQAQTLENAAKAASMGLEVEYDPNTGEAVIKGGKVEAPATPFSNDMDFNNDISGNPIVKAEKKTVNHL